MYHPSIISAATYNTLKTIFEQDIIRKHFALASGTSLALQLQHRHSIDLDIFSPAPIDTEYLQLILSSQQDIDFRLVNSNRNMLFAFINSIKCDFIYEPSKVLHPFLVADSINYFHISDIAAMKLHTICGRGKKKYFFDIYVLLQNYSLEKLLEWFGNKYDESQFYFLWRSITYFSDADEDPEIAGIPPYNKTWEEIKAFITKSCT